jgi:hypothetical protein
LGEAQRAAEELDALLTAHASKGALVLGYLHRMRARVALLARELDLAEQHVAGMERCYRPLRVPSLFVLCDELREALRCARDPSDASAQRPAVELPGGDAHLLTCVELIMTGQERAWAERSRDALQIALDLARADRGFVLDPSEESPLVSLGAAPDEDVIAWARARLQALDDTDDQTVAVAHDALVERPDLATFSGARYRMTALFVGEGRPMAALVLGSAAGDLSAPHTPALRLIGERLTRSRSVDEP